MFKEKILKSKWKLHPLTLLQIIAIILSFYIGSSVCGFKKVRHTHHEFAKYFPQCRSEKYAFNQHIAKLSLSNTQTGQLLYILRNVGTKMLYLQHPSDDPVEQASWMTNLRAGHITAFAMDRDHFELHCFIKEPRVFKGKKSYKPVSCQMHIAICTVPTADFVKGAQGTYWAAENFESPIQFAKRLHKKGIYW